MKDYIVGRGSKNDKNSISLGTRKTDHIPNEMRLEKLPEALKFPIGEVKKLHPNAMLRTASNTYNCVGMVFATRRTWVEPEYIRTFLMDDNYRPLSSINETQIGDVVIYKDKDNKIAHVGIIIERKEDFEKNEAKFKVLSKWGDWAEYVHDPEDVLESFGKPVEFWTDRKQL